MNLSERALRHAVAKGYSVDPSGHPRSPVGRPLAFRTNAGHAAILVVIEGRRFNVPVHRMVAFAKFGDRILASGTHVRHLDGDRLNNAFENIDIGSPSDNSMDREPAVRLASARRAARPLRRLSSTEVGELRARRARGETYAALMRRFGLAKSTVSYVCRGMTYKQELERAA